MHLLVIGGTVFLGRHLVSQALAAGHQVTTLNRGRQNLPEQDKAEKLIDDREKDLDILSGRHFDAVIDTCGYRPEIVSHSLRALKESVETYVFISTVSVYGEFRTNGITENDPIKYTLPGQEENYGTLKADCEKAVLELIPAEALIIRPGLIVGPYDPTDRFTYWPARVARGGKILAPGQPERAIQFTDVRDLAEWILKLTEMRARGIFNAKGSKDRLTMGEFLETCKQTINSDCDFLWVDENALVEAGVQPWTELPLWIPASNLEFAGFMELNCRKAFDSGLAPRPLAETIADTLAWDQTRDPSMPRKAGMLPDREEELLNQAQAGADLRTLT
jgi:2'-hydroxyisoflavone reductase